MASIITIFFKNNGNILGRMLMAEDKMFCELVENFSKDFALKKEDEANFFLDSKEIKSSSKKALKELGIKGNSIIDVKTKTPINNPFISQPLMEMNPNPIMGMNPNSLMGMNPNPFMGMNPNPIIGMNPNPFMGMNPYPFMGMNHFNNMYNKDKNIQIIFAYYLGNVITLQANIDTSFSELSKRFCKEAGIQDNNLVYNSDFGDILPTDNRSLSQLYIHNNSLIFVSFNIIIIFCHHGKHTLVQTTKETKFSDLCEIFLNITGIQDEDPVYIYHANKIESTDCRTLAELKMDHQSKIDVIFCSEVIGA